MVFILIGIFIVILLAISGFVFFQNNKNVYEDAIELAKSGNYIDAKILIRKILDNDPGNSFAQFTMAKIFRLEGEEWTELEHLEEVKRLGNFNADINEIEISNRIADIYYKNNKFEESIFHYLDTITKNPDNLEANLRVGFMALGQKEFKIADKFFSNISSQKINILSYHIAKGIIHTNLGKGGEIEYFEKAFQLDPTSTIAGFLYAIVLAYSSKHKDAIEIAKKILKTVEDQYVQYVLNQFIMAVYINLKDFEEALTFSKSCIDIAKKNKLQYELIDSEIHFSMIALRLKKYSEATEYLIDAEFERPENKLVLNLANYKFEVEKPDVIVDQISIPGFNINEELSKLFSELFPTERLFEISSLKSPVSVNITGILDENGNKIIKKIRDIGENPLEKFRNSKSTDFKNICVKIAILLDYNVSREILIKESDGVNLIGFNKLDKDTKVLFVFKKWKDAKISDIFLRNVQSELEKYDTRKAIVIGDYDLTDGAKKFIQENRKQFLTIYGKEFIDLLKSI